MHHPAPPSMATTDPRFRRAVGHARRVLAVERLWPLVLPPLALAGLFLALALFDVLPLLPGWLHGLMLAAFAGAEGYLVWRILIHWRPPTESEAARRVEEDSGFAHQPLAALSDSLAAGADDPLAMALWHAHRRRVIALAGELRVGWPEPGMARRDPHGLRAAVLLLLVVAATMGWNDAGRRLARAFSPGVTLSGLGPDSVEAWITPPAYTGAAPIRLRPGDNGPVVVPAGSSVLAIVSGGWGMARLDIDGVRTAFTRQADGQQRIETRMETGHGLAITQGGLTVARWPLQVVPDAVPSVGFTGEPETGDRGRLRFALTGSDDYGLARLWVAIRRIEDPEGEPTVVELPLSGHPRDTETSAWTDLTAHPWAGLPVSATPMAADALGQQAAGEPVTLTLPERAFTHPVARLLADQRKELTRDRGAAAAVAGVLDALVAQPESLGGDLSLVLALGLARADLADPGFDLAEVQDLLWSAAVKLEDGDLAGAEKGLEDARRELQKALDDNASSAMVDRLLDEFQQALARYLDAVAQRMAQTGAPPQAGQPDSRVVSEDELRQMLDGMRGMNEAGARAALQRMLGELDHILSNLQTAPQGGPSQQAMQGLADLARRQQGLLDQSFRETQRGPQDDGASAADAARQQQSLRSDLGAMAGQLGGDGQEPSPLGEADRAMGAATEALGQGDWEAAAHAQSEALQALRDGARQAMAAGVPGAGMMPRDPMGRPMAGLDDGSTHVPGPSEIQRARQILDELRRRAGDFRRPDAERDYLRRLLQQF